MNNSNVNQVDWTKLQKLVTPKIMGIPEELTTELYFETKDHDIITGTYLRNVMHLIWGDNTSLSNDVVRKFAEECEYIIHEVDNPSLTSLVKNNHTTTAITLYYKYNHGISIIDAKNYIYKLKKSVEDELLIKPHTTDLKI